MTNTYHVIPNADLFDVVERNLVTGDWRVMTTCTDEVVANAHRIRLSQMERDRLLKRAQAWGY